MSGTFRLARSNARDRKVMVGIFLLGVITSWLMGCQSGEKKTDPAAPSADQTLRHDLWVTVNGVNFQGTGVAERAEKYQVTVWPEGSIDRIIWRTCNREEVVDRPRNGFWERIQGNNSYSFTIEPTKDLEDGRSCALQVTVLEEKQRRNGFAVIDFEDPRDWVKLPATLKCNGKTAIGPGVSICQSAAGLFQRIEFTDPALSAGVTGPCDVMGKEPKKVFEFAIPSGECTYYFGSTARKTADGKRLFHRMNTIGYDAVPYRGE